MYRMLRDSGMSILGAALMASYVTLIAGPLLSFVDWYGKNYVGEAGFEFDDDFDGDVEFIEESPWGKFPLETITHDPNIKYDDSMMGPPTGSKEWEDWIDNAKRD